MCADLPGRQSVITEASSMWVDSSKLFSMAVQPTEGGANLYTQNLVTGGLSLENNSHLEKDDAESEVMALNPPIAQDLSIEHTPTAESSRQNQASSPVSYSSTPSSPTACDDTHLGLQ